MNEAERKEALLAEQRQGADIERFLTNETVIAVLNGLELSYYQAWKDSNSPSDREALFARVSAFDDLKAALQGVVASGDRATHELELMKLDTV